MEDRITGIYKLTSPSGKVYIGQSWNLKDRKRHYRKHYCKKQPVIFKSLEKYGFDAHEFKIIQELPNDVEQITLDAYEQLYMDLYRDAQVELMNVKEAGNNGKHSEESKRKMSVYIKSEKQRQTARENIAKAHLKPHTQKQRETSRKNAEKMWATPRSEKQKAQLAALRNRERTPEEREFSRQLMIKLNTRVRTEEQMQAMRNRGRYAGSLPRTPKQIEASINTLLAMHARNRELKNKTKP